jgi:hypothetical protein
VIYSPKVNASSIAFSLSNAATKQNINRIEADKQSFSDLFLIFTNMFDIIISTLARF